MFNVHIISFHLMYESKLWVFKQKTLLWSRCQNNGNTTPYSALLNMLDNKNGQWFQLYSTTSSGKLKKIQRIHRKSLIIYISAF